MLYTTYLFAEDVNIDLISVIKEKDLPGVEILPMSTRQYNTSAAALLLGQTGPISAESWEANQGLLSEEQLQHGRHRGPVRRGIRL